ncbi:MAG: uncharacterized protein PWP47_715 [Synergistaceae bacterium]|jgi:hypothetical protein|nr:uncharacterized protein [Synergistaceae bacterium]
MKKGIRVLALFGLAVIFTASAAFAAPQQLTMATGGTAGTYYPLGGAMSQIISDNSDGKVNITAQSTGASIENINLLAAGDVDLIIVQNDLSDYAAKGTEFFKDRKIGNLTAIARLYPETIHVVASKDSGIKTFADFKGKNISVGAPGSGNEANARQIFGIYGLKYEDFKPHFISYAETTDHFKDRLVDAFIYTTGAPNPSIQDISTLQDIVFIPIDGEMRDKLIENYPFFAKDVIPGGTYRGQDEPVETVAVQAILAARKELSEDVVYTITKALFSNLEAVGNAHHKGKSMKLSNALDGISVPVHPGAVKFYKEVGLMK